MLWALKFFSNSISIIYQIKSIQSIEKILNIKISSKIGNLIILISNFYDSKIINKNGKIKTIKIYKSGYTKYIGKIPWRNENKL